MIGIVLRAPSPRAATRGQARRVRAAVPAGIPLVGVFVDEDPERIDELVDAAGLDRVQLHGSEARRADRALRRARDPRRARRRRLRVPVGVPVIYDRPPGRARATSRRWTPTGAPARAVAGDTLLLAGRLDRTTSRSAVRAAAPGASTSRAASRALAGHQGPRRRQALRRRGQGGLVSTAARAAPGRAPARRARPLRPLRGPLRARDAS